MKFHTCLALLLACILHITTAAPSEDEITDLPGIPSPPPTFKQYSGYLDSIKDIHLHYWFVESQSKAESDPVVLWLNGGPGCSSVFGFLAENGPFHVNIDGKSLYNNDYAWNKIANVLYLESPAGVGFSYSDSGNTTTDDDQTAATNYAALKSFFKKFPEYSSNEFYITGESYGGIYIPTLSVLVVADDEINFKGFAIGNGMHNYTLDSSTSLLNEAFHGLCSAKTLENLLTYCCVNNSIPSCDFSREDENCQQAVNDAHDCMSTINCNPYYIYDDCPVDSFSMFIAERLHYSFRKGHKNKFAFKKPFHGVFMQILENTSQKKKMIKTPSDDPYCYTATSIPTWINQPSVRNALHISEKADVWFECGFIDYRTIYDSTTSLYKILLPKVRAMLYNGDADTVCSYLQGQYFVENLDLEVIQPYSAWSLDDRTVGFFKGFTNLTFVTIMNAGHMVPSNQPAAAFELFKNFIKNENFKINN